MANLAVGGINITSKNENLFIDLKEKIKNNPDFAYEGGPDFLTSDGRLQIDFNGRWDCNFAWEYIDSLMADTQYIYRQELINAEISGWQEEFSCGIFEWYRKAPGETELTSVDPYKDHGLFGPDDFWGAILLIVPKLPEPGETLQISDDFSITVLSKNEISPQLTRYTIAIKYGEYDIECTFTDDDDEFVGENFAETYSKELRDESYKLFSEIYNSGSRPGFYDEEMNKSLYETYYGVIHKPYESNSARDIIRQILYKFFDNSD